jgi:hypothetical protein
MADFTRQSRRGHRGGHPRVIFAVAFGAATIAAVGPNGAFFAVFSTLIGMAVGISIGLGLVRWIRGGKDTETTVEVPPSNRPKVELSKSSANAEDRHQTISSWRSLGAAAAAVGTRRAPDWALLLGPENDQLILIDAHTLLVYDETLHTIDHPDG